jgi:hypothetical protein
MALRTISPSGGSWSATSSWVEGIVPTSSDNVVGNSASGDIILTSTSHTIQRIDLTEYTGTIVMANRRIILGQGRPTTGTATGTSYFGASVSYSYTAGSNQFSGDTGGMFELTTNHNIYHYFATGSQPIPGLRLNNSISPGTVLYTDVHVKRVSMVDAAVTNRINDNSLFIYEYVNVSSTNGVGVLTGTTKYIFVGNTNSVSASNIKALQTSFVNTTLEIRSDVYSWLYPTILVGTELITSTSSDCSKWSIVLNNNNTNNDTVTFSCYNKIGSVRIRTFLGTQATTYNINTKDNGLLADYVYTEAISPYMQALPFSQNLLISSFHYMAPSNHDTITNINFNGVGCQIDNLISLPIFRFANTTITVNSTNITKRLAPSLNFDNIGTYSISNLQVLGVDGTSNLKSITASQDAKLILGTNSYIFDTSITDIDNSGGDTLYLYGLGTVSSSTNVEYGPPTGGGGGQFGFASIN